MEDGRVAVLYAAGKQDRRDTVLSLWLCNRSCIYAYLFVQKGGSINACSENCGTPQMMWVSISSIQWRAVGLHIAEEVIISLHRYRHCILFILRSLYRLTNIIRDLINSRLIELVFRSTWKSWEDLLSDFPKGVSMTLMVKSSNVLRCVYLGE